MNSEQYPTGCFGGVGERFTLKTAINEILFCPNTSIHPDMFPFPWWKNKRGVIIGDEVISYKCKKYVKGYGSWVGVKRGKK